MTSHRDAITGQYVTAEHAKVTHPTAGVVLSTRDHAAAIAYADRLAREEQR